MEKPIDLAKSLSEYITDDLNCIHGALWFFNEEFTFSNEIWSEVEKFLVINFGFK